jgi:hypothetical protein
MMYDMDFRNTHNNTHYNTHYNTHNKMNLIYFICYVADDVRYEFKKYGPIADVWIARQPPGFAFVDVSIYMYMYVCIYKIICIFICIYIYIYIHNMLIHAYT